jgi:hypothetical protein
MEVEGKMEEGDKKQRCLRAAFFRLPPLRSPFVAHGPLHRPDEYRLALTIHRCHSHVHPSCTEAIELAQYRQLLTFAASEGPWSIKSGWISERGWRVDTSTRRTDLMSREHKLATDLAHLKAANQGHQSSKGHTRHR